MPSRLTQGCNRGLRCLSVKSAPGGCPSIHRLTLYPKRSRASQSFYAIPFPNSVVHGH
jgi:hypothetical protein